MVSAVRERVTELFETATANAGASHAPGCAAARIVDEARASVAAALAARPAECLFTGGGTEGNTLALAGVVRAARAQGVARPHVIVGAAEHPSVDGCRGLIDDLGGEVSTLPVDAHGAVCVDQLARLIRPDTVLVSAVYANNEVGTISPIPELARAVAEHRTHGIFPLVHTDATQAPLYLSCSVKELGVDLMTLDGQKIGGPKGSGMLYVRDEAPLAPLFCGGQQERGLRPGTENVPLIGGFVQALQYAQQGWQERASRVARVRDALWTEIQKRVPDAKLLGDPTRRLANNLYVHVPDVSAEYLAAYLDARGIFVSTKSACLGPGEKESPTLRSIGGAGTRGIRFSLGEELNSADCAHIAETFAAGVAVAGTAPGERRKDVGVSSSPS